MKANVILILIILCSGLFMVLESSAQITVTKETADVAGPVSQTAVAFASTRPVRAIAAEKRLSERLALNIDTPIREVGAIGNIFAVAIYNLP